MKNAICLLLVLLSFEGFAQITTTDSSATIIFYRNAGFSASAVSIRLRDTLGNVIRLYDESYYVYKCKPGDYRFSVDKKKWKILVNAKAGKTYYYKASVYSGMWSVQYDVEEMDSVKASQSLSKGPYLDMNKPLIRPKNRVGAGVALGFGFAQKSIAVTTNGDDVSLSFGRGASIGLCVGREFTKHLDMEVSYRYMSGGLSPSSDDGSMDFSRHIISFTPAFIIPIDGGYTQRIKLGIGTDIYLGNTLEIKMGKVPGGINDTWKYDNTFGYHLSAVYEANTSQRWSFCYGLRYYTTQHKFASGNTYFPIDDFFAKPDGSGMDIVIGVAVHF